jgi:hypothetical protein
MTALQTLHAENKNDLIDLYKERIADKDFKTALGIKLKIAQLDAIYLGKPVAEPEAAPDSFATQQAVVKYLTDQGWKANDSTLSLHVQQRKLVPQTDGTFALADIDSYAIANLVNNPNRAEKTSSDELTLEAKQLENRRLRMKVEQAEGTLVNSDDVKRELENMLVSFRARVLIIPRKLSSQLAQMTDQNKVEEILTRELRDTLSTLSQYHIEAPEAVQ